MKAFVDASTLFKRYVDEPGRQQFLDLLDEMTCMAVAPVCLIEMHTIIARRIRERLITQSDAVSMLNQVRRDFCDIETVSWSADLQRQSIEITAQWELRTLDSIVLASGCLAGPDLFITSDKKLYQAATRLFQQATLIA